MIGMVAACPFPSSQGSQVLIRQLSHSLSDRGHSVHVIAYPFGDLPPDPYYTLHRAYDVFPWRKLDPGPSLAKPFLDVLLLAKVISVVRREGIEIIHGHNYEGIILAWKAARWLGIPVVYYCHSLLADELPTYFTGENATELARKFGSFVDRFTRKISDHVIAVSPDIARASVESGNGTEKTTFVPPGIRPEEWEGAASLVETGNSEGPTVIYTGNLAPFQNIPQLLEAVRTVVEEVPSLKLRVITSSATEPLVDMARRLGIDNNLSVVTENDFRSIVPHLLAADIACSTRTMRSGFPIKNLNYMAAGLPVVCYASGSPGMIDGETGLVVEDNNPKALAGSMLALLKDRALRRKMGDRAREVAFREYDWRDLSETVETIHERLILR